ncbi:MAG: NAD(P)H-dependent glycerol-3-phosphate dehydrogenase [bacterium]
MSKMIAIIGDGGWGTALGLTLLNKGHRVRVWGPFPETIAKIKATGENHDYLPGVRLPAALEWTADRLKAVEKSDVVVLAMPTKYFRTVLTSFVGLIPAHAQVLSVAKGLDGEDNRRMTEVAEGILKREAVAALSGPSFASEVAAGAPTAVVIASRDAALARSLQAVFNTQRFRVYTSDDVVGVELGGTLKNVIAVGVGVCDGMGLGHNARAALVTRGLAEITRLGVAMGANPVTFAGLSGMGDLVLTCTSRLSRNYSVGERMGKGEKIADILSGMKQVAEGVENSAIAHSLARRLGVPAPITGEVYDMVHQGKAPADAVESLLGRDPRPERDR